MFWEGRPGSVKRRQDTRERKTMTGTLKLLKDCLMLSNVIQGRRTWDDNSVHSHSFCSTHRATYL